MLCRLMRSSSRDCLRSDVPVQGFHCHKTKAEKAEETCTLGPGAPTVPGSTQARCRCRQGKAVSPAGKCYFSVLTAFVSSKLESQSVFARKTGAERPETMPMPQFLVPHTPLGSGRAGWRAWLWPLHPMGAPPGPDPLQLSGQPGRAPLPGASRWHSAPVPPAPCLGGDANKAEANTKAFGKLFSFWLRGKKQKLC